MSEDQERPHWFTAPVPNLAALQAENARLRDALGFYAAPATHHTPGLKMMRNFAGDAFPLPPIFADKGKVARAALGAEKPTKGETE